MKPRVIGAVLLCCVLLWQPSQAEDSEDGERLEVLKRVRRVIGGSEVEAGKWPWLVHLKGKIPIAYFWGIPYKYQYFYCGASVINKRWLMTAAHCFHPLNPPQRITTPKYWHATIGEVDSAHDWLDRLAGFFGRTFGGNSQDKIWYIHATEIHWHPEFNPSKSWKHDIAVMRLEKDLPIGSNPNINAVTLPTSNTIVWPPNGQQCVMKGWGCTENGGKVTDLANDVILPIVAETTCRRYYEYVSETRICAGQNVQDSGICPGDSGGPLVCKDYRNEWVQVGIASYTSRDQPHELPGVFTRTSHYLTWVVGKVGSISQ